MYCVILCLSILFGLDMLHSYLSIISIIRNNKITQYKTMSATVIGAPVDGLSGKCNAVEFSTIDVAFLMQVLPNFHFT